MDHQTPTQSQSLASSETGEALACLKELVGLLLAAQSKSIDLNQPMDAQQCADWLGLTKGTVNRHAENGAIPAFRAGGQWRFHPLTILKEGHARQMIKPSKKPRKKRVPTLPIAA